MWLRVEVHRVRCRRCGVRTERLPFVDGKAHYTARLEAAVAQDCEAAAVSRVAAQRGLPPETVRRMDKRVLRRWAAARPRTPLHYLGVDEIFLGKTVKFLTVVSDLETGEPLWVGLERKQETLGRFFDDLGADRAGQLTHVSADGAEWIHLVDLDERLASANYHGRRESGCRIDGLKSVGAGICRGGCPVHRRATEVRCL